MSEVEEKIDEEKDIDEKLEWDTAELDTWDSEVEVIEISSSDSVSHSPSFAETEKLIKERITWFRKWSKDLPNYLHSFHVRDILRDNRFDETIQMAWLLHDIVEDWNTSFDELRELWYSEEVIRLVDLATHDSETKDSFQRWKDMMKRLEDACDRDAWAIKLADICDNVYLCHLMPSLKSRKRFLYQKCPYFVEQGNKWFWWSEFYLEFVRRYLTQLKRLSVVERKRSAWRVWWLVTRLAFLWAVGVWFYGYYVNDFSLMELWLSIWISLAIFMWIMHIICFRIPHLKVDY